MSKGNINSEISIQYIDSLINAVGDLNSSIKVISEMHKGQIESQKKYYEAVINKYNKGEASEKELIKAISSIVKEKHTIDLDLKDTSRYTKAFNKLERGLAEAIRGKRVDDILLNKVITAFSNFESSALIQSSKATVAGTNNAVLRNIDNENVKKILKDISKSMNASNDSAVDKIKSFFGEHFYEAKKGLRMFGAELIEGLAKNKFVGGALSDTITLLSYLGAGLLRKYFGELGGKIGAGLVALGQVISGLLPTILTSLLVDKLFLGGKFSSLLGNAFRGGFNALKGLFGGGRAKLPAIGTQFKTEGAWLAYKDNLSLGHDYAMKVAKAREVSDLRKVGGFAKSGLNLGKAGLTLGKFGMNVARGIPGLVGGLALDWGANKAVDMGANASLAHGISGAGQGAITGAILGSWIPVLGTAAGAGVGAVIGGIAGIIKGFREDTKEHNKAMEDNAKKSEGFWQNFVDSLLNMLPWNKNKDENNGGGGSSGGSSGGGSLGQPMSGKDSKANIAGATTFGSLKVAKDGAILNISDLSQAEASKQLQAYEKADPTSFGKVYEWAGSNVARLGSFKTDAAKLNEKGQVTGALMYKGATDDMLALRNNVEAEFIRKGYDPTRAHALANSLAYTSGKMTGSNTQHKGKGKWKSHDNVYGFGFDIGGGQAWSEKEYDAVAGVVKDFYKTKGLQVAYEGAGQGASTGKHWDIKPIKDMRAKGAQEILDEKKEKQKAVSEQHSMDAAYILMKEDEQLARKILKEHSSETPEEIGKRYEEALNKKGIYNRPFTTDKGTQGVWVRETDEGSKVIDYSENSSFTEDYLRNVTRNGAGQ